jgi:hypothetical protein
MEKDRFQSKIGDEFIVEAIRPPQRAGIERLLAGELAMAHFSKPLEKIRHILEAYQLVTVDPEAREALGLDEETHTIMQRLYICCVSLQNKTSVPPMEKLVGQYIGGFKIGWGFPYQEAWKHLFWLPIPSRVKLYFYESTDGFDTIVSADFIERISKELYRQVKDEDDIIVGKPSEEYIKQAVELYFRSSEEHLDYGSYLKIENKFVDYTMPKALDLSRKIYSHFIDPETYDLYIGYLGGRYGLKNIDKEKPY